MYMAPEILYNDQYQGQASDLFALAVILFSMRSKHQPFDKMASKKDSFYKLIVQNRADLFWKAWEQYHTDDPNFYSDEFKDLITAMIDFYPHKRPLMADIIGHPWMQGECATPEEIAQEFAERKILVEAPKAEEVAIPHGGGTEVRRGGIEVSDYIFVYGDLTEAEKEDPMVVNPALKPLS